MRVLFVPDPTAPNGEDAFCRELSKRVSLRGHEAKVQAIPYGPRAATVQRLKATGFAAKTDVVLLNSLHPAGLLAAKAAGAKTVVRIIEALPCATPEVLEEARNLLVQADLILIPNHSFASLLKDWGLNGQIRVVPYAYEKILAKEIALVTMEAAQPHGFSMAAVSSLNAETKPGFETLLNAVSGLRFDHHLHVIGAGPAMESLSERAQKISGGRQVTFLGELRPPQIMEYLRASKAFIDPCGIEGFPVLALHAMSEGCPVVAARTPFNEELVRHGENGLLFEPGNPAAVSEALVTLFSEKGFSLKIIHEGMRTVSSLTWDKTADTALAALEGLFAEKGSR